MCALESWAWREGMRTMSHAECVGVTKLGGGGMVSTQKLCRSWAQLHVAEVERGGPVRRGLRSVLKHQCLLSGQAGFSIVTTCSDCQNPPGCLVEDGFVLSSWGSCNRHPRLRGLVTEVHPLPVPEARSTSPRGGQAGSHQASLFGVWTAASSCVHTWSSLCVCPCPQLSL